MHFDVLCWTPSTTLRGTGPFLFWFLRDTCISLYGLWKGEPMTMVGIVHCSHHSSFSRLSLSLSLSGDLVLLLAVLLGLQALRAFASGKVILFYFTISKNYFIIILYHFTIVPTSQFLFFPFYSLK